MLQKGLSQGIVAMEHLCLAEGGWKMLFSIFSRRFVLLASSEVESVTSGHCGTSSEEHGWEGDIGAASSAEM